MDNSLKIQTFCTLHRQDRFLVFVHCKPWQGDLRTGVRNTWGNRRLGDINGGSKVLFVVGRNDNYRERLRRRAIYIFLQQCCLTFEFD